MDQVAVLITGVLGGLGEAAARAFKLKGYKILGVDRGPFPEHSFAAELVDEYIGLSFDDQVSLLDHLSETLDKWNDSEMISVFLDFGAVLKVNPLLSRGLDDFKLIQFLNVEVALEITRRLQENFKKNCALLVITS